MSPRTGMLSLLLQDETSRRAWNETISDWQEDSGCAVSTAGRLRADLRGSLSVLRMLLLTTGRQMATHRTWQLCGWMTLLAVGLSLLSPFGWAYALRLTEGRGFPHTMAVRLFVVPSSLVMAFALVSAFGAGQTRHRSSPVLGTMILSLTLALLVTGWLEPASNKLFRIELETLSRTAPPGADRFLPGRGAVELSLPDLVRESIHERNQAFGARRVLSYRLVLLLAVPTGFVLGAALRSRFGAGRGWRPAQFAGAASLILAAVAGSYAWPLLSRMLTWAIAVRLERLNIVLWLGLAFVCVAVFVLVRSLASEQAATVSGANA
jgi:hypothetical protein